MRALVISGGGSKGAFAGGVSEYLIKDLDTKYDIFVGTSTGSLLVPQLSIGNVGKVKQTYTNVRQNDIYSTCPFITKHDKDGNRTTSINHFNTIKMFLKRKKTFGEHLALRKTIEKAISKEDFERIQNSQKHVVVTVSNLTTNKVEYKYAKDCEYHDFLDWLWASSSFVPFMSIVQKNGYEYADGGFGNYIPIEEAINLGATEIDVIVLSPRHEHVKKAQTKNAFDVLLRALLFMNYQLGRHDLMIGHLESIYNDDVKVNFIFSPRILTDHSFIFDPREMKAWWHEGYEYAKVKYAKKKKGF